MLILGVVLGVTLGVILGVTLGVMLILGVTLGVTLGVMLILGVMLGVILGVTLGVMLMLGVILGVMLGVTLGVTLGLLVIEGVIEGDGDGLDDGDGGGTILAGRLVITTIPCSYIILPTYSFTLYKLLTYTLPSPSSNKVPLTGLSNLKVLGLIKSPYSFEGIDMIPILSVGNVFWGFKVVSSKL